ncbi:hypothetical protein E4T48_05898 [Aureobasidium sp. EXF-10727]|nr:hypothetical protein E4T48_05898 [Aureobasidium sp. EXF-10727]KAI4726033.1 hypothetical protein E4T49_06205 [Aureobasidium sp. EXF-10728]
MPKPIEGLEARKEDLRKWVCEQDLSVKKVIEKLKTEHNVICQKRTLERHLKLWDISKRTKMNKEALQQELTRLCRGPQMTDEAIANILNQAGHVINPRTVMDTRKRLGLHKRIRPEVNEQDLQKTIKELLVEEYKNEEVLKMHRGELYTYMRQKYPHLNIVGRDRVYNIAREMNPHLIRRYPKGHSLHQNRPYKLSGKRLAAKLAKDDAAASSTDQPHDSSAPPEEPSNFSPVHTDHLLQPHDATSLGSIVGQDHQPAPAYQPPAAIHQALHPSLRLESLEKENDALHQRLQQQDAEIQYMRQAYHDLMQRLGPVPGSKPFPT